MTHSMAQDTESRSDDSDEGESRGGSSEDDNEVEDQIAQEIQN